MIPCINQAESRSAAQGTPKAPGTPCMPHWEVPQLLFLPALLASASGTKTQGATCRTWGRSFNEICGCLDSCRTRSALG